jgi:hypothetical protein
MILALQRENSESWLAYKATKVIRAKITRQYGACDYCEIGPISVTWSDIDGTKVIGYNCKCCSSKFHSGCVDIDRMCLNHSPGYKIAICEICAWSTPDALRKWHACIACHGSLCGNCNSSRCQSCLDKTCTVCDRSNQVITFTCTTSTRAPVKICVHCYQQDNMRMCSFCHIVFPTPENAGADAGRCPQTNENAPCDHYNCPECVKKSIYCHAHMRELINGKN